MSATTDAPRDNLFRGLHGKPLELRAAEASTPTLFGHFDMFETWAEIDSYFEGRFIERTVGGAYRKTINENRDRLKVQYDHGYDSYFGSSPLGPIDVLREDDEGPYYEVPLLDASYNHERLLPMLQGRLMDGTITSSVLGASHRFRVTKEEWVQPSKATDYNPEKLPERTIREKSLYEFGPVAFPAQIEATAGARSLSLTDHYFERHLARTGQAARAAQRLHQISAAALGTASETPNEPPTALGGQTTPQGLSRSKRVALALAR